MSRKTKVERRHSCRYQTLPVPILLGWWVAGLYQTLKGVLLDISLDGASVCVLSAPPDGVVFLCFETDSPEWLEAVIVGREAMPRRSGFQIRLRLRETCRYDLFRTVVPGYSLDATRPAQKPKAADDARHWR